MKKGNIPAYIMGIISIATSLGAYIFVSTTSDAKSEIKTIQEVNAQQDKDIAHLQTSVDSILKSQTRMDDKLDKILEKVK